MATNVKSSDRDLSSEKVEAILSGAMQEFLAHGYAGARIDRIVEAAGVSKATVYRHFPDKEALFTALIQHLACFRELFRLHHSRCYDEDPIDFLKRYASEMLNDVERDPQHITFLRMVFGESGRFPELGRAFVRNIAKPNLDFLTQYFSTHPKLKIADPEVTARIFVGTLIHFVMLQNALHGDDIIPMERDRLLDSLLALIVHPE